MALRGPHPQGFEEKVGVGPYKVETNKLSERSQDSSVDEEMLGKIKDIYSEMRKHTGSTQFYALPAGGQQPIT